LLFSFEVAGEPFVARSTVPCGCVSHDVCHRSHVLSDC